MITVSNKIANGKIGLGALRALRVSAGAYPAGLSERIDELIKRRRSGLSLEEEALRLAIRNMLRNGKYKPTGRGKPASEYLLREASSDSAGFPRVNGFVDVANFVSLKYLLPVSLWDVDAAGSSAYCFRLGLEGESYVFNSADQRIELEDLVVGCATPSEEADPRGRPIVNPVRDSLQTKSTERTYHIAVTVYYPVESVDRAFIQQMAEEFSALLSDCGQEVEISFRIVAPGEIVTL